MTTTLEVEDIQSLVFSGHSRLQGSIAVGLTVRDVTRARTLLHALIEREVSFGFGGGARTCAVQLLLTAPGVLALGGSEADLDGFSRQFRQGIVSPQRSRALGDSERNRPAAWAWDDSSFHALLLLYAPEPALVSAEWSRVFAPLAAGWTRVCSFPFQLPASGREPFGFNDGLSLTRIDVGEGRGERPGVTLLPPGEVVLGHPNAAGVTPPAPALGENASLVVIRQLEQDVQQFWNFWRGAGKDEQEAVWLAAKAVGRWPNGMPVDGSAAAPEPPFDREKAIAPLRFSADSRGLKCPFGSHIRRANPRDGLLDDPAASLEIVGQHRIVRRGRVYGPPAPAEWYPSTLRAAMTAAGADPTDPARGLFFILLCADVARQFEFIQQTWLNNPKFSDLYNEVDPIAAGYGIPADSHRFSIPRAPLRCRVNGVTRWVGVRGGGYFLMPGKRALRRFLATSI